MSDSFDLSAYAAFGGDAFNAYFGTLLVDRSKPAGAPRRFALMPEAKQLNGGGALHGGFLMTMADNILGMTAHEAIDGKMAATVTLNTDFLSAGTPDAPIFGQATVTRATRSLIFVSGDLSQNDRVLMSASGIWKVIGA